MIDKMSSSEEQENKPRQDIVNKTKKESYEILEDSIQAVTMRNMYTYLSERSFGNWNIKVENLRGIYKISITSKKVEAKEEPQIAIGIKPDGKINIKINPYDHYKTRYYTALNLTEKEAKEHSVIFTRITENNRLIEACEDILPSHKFNRFGNNDVIPSKYHIPQVDKKNAAGTQRDTKKIVKEYKKK